MTYATTCSKPRVGEFGGGVIVVTADEIEWLDAQSIADDRKSEGGCVSSTSNPRS